MNTDSNVTIPNKNTGLDAILAEMVSLANSRDTEIAHQEADALLIRTVSLLAEGMPLDVQEKVALVLEAWRKIGKWYA